MLGVAFHTWLASAAYNEEHADHYELIAEGVMKEIDRVVRDGKTGRTWTVGFLSWRPTEDANYPDLRGRMRLGCTPASGNKIYIEVSAADARNDDAILEEIRKDPNA